MFNIKTYPPNVSSFLNYHLNSRGGNFNFINPQHNFWQTYVFYEKLLF